MPNLKDKQLQKEGRSVASIAGEIAARLCSNMEATHVELAVVDQLTYLDLCFHLETAEQYKRLAELLVRASAAKKLLRWAGIRIAFNYGDVTGQIISQSDGKIEAGPLSVEQFNGPSEASEIVRGNIDENHIRSAKLIADALVDTGEPPKLPDMEF